jgi:hypothetical protein
MDHEWAFGKLLRFLSVIYAAGAIVTYGHAVESWDCTWKPDRADDEHSCYLVSAGEFGIFAAIAWPLYWSYELQHR